MNTIFAEDYIGVSHIDGYATRQEAEASAKSLSKLGFPIVRVTEDPNRPSVGREKAYLFESASGYTLDVGNAETGLRMAVKDFLEQYPNIAAAGPKGINWHCTEGIYHEVRSKCAAIGLVVHDGGTISEYVNDIEAIGHVGAFGNPPVGAKTEANFVVRFEPVNGSERPVCNAAFLAEMLALSPEAAKAFVASRAVFKGYIASPKFSGFVTSFGGE